MTFSSSSNVQKTQKCRFAVRVNRIGRVETLEARRLTVAAGHDGVEVDPQREKRSHRSHLDECRCDRSIHCNDGGGGGIPAEIKREDEVLHREEHVCGDLGANYLMRCFFLNKLV